MRRYIAVLWILLTALLPSSAQVYKYLGVTDGLSDRRVLSIQKDSTGYMWFLTYTGIDRFDGKNFKPYRISSAQGYVTFSSEKNILKSDSQGRIWSINPNGALFLYDPLIDNFKEVPLPEEIRQRPLDMADVTEFNEIWFCNSGGIFIYDIDGQSFRQIPLTGETSSITCLCQSDKETYFIGTEKGVTQSRIDDKQLVTVQHIAAEYPHRNPQTIYYHRPSNRLVIGYENDGVTIYDLTLKKVEQDFSQLKNFPISSIAAYGENQILIATQGAGVYCYNFKDETLEQCFVSDNRSLNKMNGNHIRTLYIDDQQRVWMSVYPTGITVYDNLYPSYTWFKNHIGNPNSIGNNQINHVIEDSEGDIWYATNNGLSIYKPKEQQWEHLFTQEEEQPQSLRNNHTFLSLCEVSPGVVLAGGYMTGVSIIDKKNRTSRLVTLDEYRGDTELPSNANRVIRCIHKDNEGLVWTGGNHYLGCIDPKTQTFRSYPIENSITCILQKDSVNLLIGTGDGIYRLNKADHTVKRLRMPFSSQHINAMYLYPNGDLYIGTTNSGLVVLYANGEYKIYTYKISSLLTNTVNSIIPQNNDYLVLTTNQNVALFDIRKKRFYNWTYDQGLIKASFNPRAGVHTSYDTFIFGCDQGAIEVADTFDLPRHIQAEVLIDQVLIDDKNAISFESVRQEEFTDLNSVKRLTLNHDENSLAFHIASINFYNPQYTYFQWKMNGIQDYWTLMGKDNWLRFKDLPPGEYTLKVQIMAQEDYSVIKEKEFGITILPSFWQTGWGILLTLLGIATVIFLILSYNRLWKTVKECTEKIRIFTETSHNQRASLSIIKAAVNEVQENEKEQLSTRSGNFLQIAAYNADHLYQTTSNLLTLELQRQSKKVQVSRHNLVHHLTFYVKLFAPLTHQRHISLQYKHEEEEVEVWADPLKTELIFYNLISCLIRNTPERGKIILSHHKGERHWSVKLSNYNSAAEFLSPQETNHHKDRRMIGNELTAIRQLIESHKGKLEYRTRGASDYTFTVTFPIRHPKYIQYKENDVTPTPTATSPSWYYPWFKLSQFMVKKPETDQKKEIRGTLLLADESLDTLSFLTNVLHEEWEITTAQSSTMALELIRENEPDIVVSGSLPCSTTDVDFCTIMKSEMATCHIPLIMITAEDDRNEWLNNNRALADYYLPVPINITLIKRTLKSIIDNRKHLNEKFGQTQIMQSLKELKTPNIEKDTMFLLELKECIRDHVHEKGFNIDVLCTFMGMSRSSLYNKVKLLTRKSVSDVIREVKMQKTCAMLLSGQYNITEVSDIMGFSEPKYFREVFKKYYGMSPSEYIKKQAQKQEKIEDEDEDEDTTDGE